MAQKFRLGPDEMVIMKTEKVGYGGLLGGKNNDLILTNENIILVKKNLFGRVSDTIRFPLSDIRVTNGRVQAQMGKKDIVTPTLDIYFKDGQESFIFEWEDDIKEWIASVSEAVTGEPAEREDPNAWILETASMVENVAGTIDRVKDTLGLKPKEQIAVKCPSCGASLAGTKGETVKCEYCGSFHTL